MGEIKMNEVALWIRAMVKKHKNVSVGYVPGYDIQKGAIYLREGKLVVVTEGTYWGGVGTSNWWVWKIINKDGSFGSSASRNPSCQASG